MARVAVGGFQHETNTFAPVKAEWRNFVAGSAFPPLLHAAELVEGTEGMNLPISGFIDEIRRIGHQIVPLVWAAAVPSGPVTDEAFERMAAKMLGGLIRILPVDAVYMDLHGAMVTERFDDGEGELLQRLRAILGPDIPLVASVDYHANLTRRMVDNADGLIGYRTYPHIDIADTGRRTARYLSRLLGGAGRPAKALRKLDFLIPLPWQTTDLEPARGLFERIAERETRSDADSALPRAVTFTPGFPLADTAETGPAIVVYAPTQAEADRVADLCASEVADAEPQFAGELLTPKAAIRRAMALRANSPGPIGPVIIADTQDNPGAGGTGDSTGMLHALVDYGATGAVFAIVYDPDCAAAAHRVGEGAMIRLSLGGHASTAGSDARSRSAPRSADGPVSAGAFKGWFVVERLGDGAFTGTGPFYSGMNIRLGPMAVLRYIDDAQAHRTAGEDAIHSRASGGETVGPDAGICVIVASARMQAADRAIFHHLGLAPEAHTLLVLKSSVHFRADFAPIASEILIAAAPGANPADHQQLPFRKLRPGVRVMPIGPAIPSQI